MNDSDSKIRAEVRVLQETNPSYTIDEIGGELGMSTSQLQRILESGVHENHNHKHDHNHSHNDNHEHPHPHNHDHSGHNHAHSETDGCSGGAKSDCCSSSGRANETEGSQPTSKVGEKVYKLNVQGMDCAGCATTVEDQLNALKGVTSVKLSFLTSRGWIVCSDSVPESAIVECVQRLGYPTKLQLQQRVDDGATPSSLSNLRLSVRGINRSDGATFFTTLLRKHFSSAVTDCELEIRTPERSRSFKRNWWERLWAFVTCGFYHLSPKDLGDREPLLINTSRSDVELGATNQSYLDQGILTIEYDASKVGARRLLEVVRQAGFSADVELASGSEVSSGMGQQQLNTLWRSLVLSWVLMIPMVLLNWVLTFDPVDSWLNTTLAGTFTIRGLLEWILATPAQIVVGYPLYLSAYRALRYLHSANMDTLVVLSTGTAYIYSVVVSFLAIFVDYKGDEFFDVCVVLLALVMLGRYLEAKSQQQASNILAEILLLQPSTALLLTTEGHDAKEPEEIPVSLLERGDVVKVLPGTKVPADGKVIFGSSAVDESSITGESLPVNKEEGSTVYAGTINQHGVLHVSVTHTASESTLETLRKMVEEAQLSRAPIQGVADKAASYFVPSIICLSIIMFGVWFALASYDIVDTDNIPIVPFSLMFALTVLVISCPCAISLAVPTAIMVACGVGAKHGILFKGGEVIDRCHRVNTVVFDKTGTLTRGKLSVTHTQLIDEKLSMKEFWTLLASAEATSEHVIAKALVAHAQEQVEGLQILSIKTSEVTPGLGVLCTMTDGRQVAIGNRDWVYRNLGSGDGSGVRIASRDEQQSVALEKNGKTLIWMVVNRTLAGFVALADTIRPEAQETLRALRERGYDVWMVSGDNPDTVRAVAQDLGLPANRALGGVLPSGKCDVIRNLQKTEGRPCVIAMIGDGINDAPALSQADVGIAIGSGTDIALESAQVVLLKDHLPDIVTLLDLARKTFTVIRCNLVWAFLYNVIGIPLASGLLYPFTGFVIPPALAGVSEMLSSLPVVFFSLGLKLYRPPPVCLGGHL